MYSHIDSQNTQQEDFNYLVNTRHVDDEDQLEYVVTRVGKLRGDIVAWRAPWLNGRIGHEETTSIHVADVVKMTAVTMGRSACRWAGTPNEGVDLEKSETSGSSAVPTAVKPLRSKYRSTSGTDNMTRYETSDERSVPLNTGENGKRGVGANDNSRPGKRSRKQNLVTNASKFGDIECIAVDVPEILESPTVRPVEQYMVNNPNCMNRYHNHLLLDIMRI
jgi:hypothetical protein